MNFTSRLLMSMCILCVCVNNAFAEETTETAEQPAKINSVNFSPIGFLFGAYSLNYERLVDGQHGLIVEGSFSSSSSGNTSSTSYGGNFGYRWHWSKTQDSGFLGAMLGFASGSGEVKEIDRTVDLTISAPSVTMNIGRRWAWEGGFNITLRFGVGRAFYSVSSNVEGSEEAVKSLEDLLNALPVTLDGELSIGWIF